MKIFNKEGFGKNLRKIVGEVVNITYNKTYYVDGVLQDKPKPKHNSYVCESIEYEIVPNMGYIYLYRKDHMTDMGEFDGIDESTVRSIAVEFGKLLNEVISKFGYENVSIPVAQPCTTQYLLMNLPANKQQQGLVKFTENPDTTIDNMSEVDFIWQILSREIEIPYVTPNTTKSLTSIIYDEVGIFELPDGYRSANFPSLAEYKIAASGRLSQNLLVANINLGLTFEIPKHYMPADELNALLDYPKKSSNKIRYIGEKTNATFTQCQRVLHFAKYEWLRFYESDKYSELNIYKQIKYGMFDKELDPDDERNNRPVCFITGIPIYGDCYVFDIYRQQIEEMVNEEDLHKYPDAKVITSEMEEEEKQIMCLLKGGKDTINPNDPYYYAFPSEKEDIQKLLKDRNASKKTKKTKKTSRSNNSDVDDNAEEEKKATPKPTAKLVEPKILRRGVKVTKPVKMVKIRYWKDYDTPRCVIISSWYMHLAIKIGKNVIYDKVTHFENMSGCRVIVYRTFCPVTCEQVIRESNATDLDKKIMLSVCKNGRFGNKLLMAEDQDVEINLHNDITMGQLVTETINGKSIMGKSEIVLT